MNTVLQAPLRFCRHWVAVTAFHFIQDGSCTFVVFPPEPKGGEGSGEKKTSDDTKSARTATSAPLRLACTKGAVVVLVRPDAAAAVHVPAPRAHAYHAHAYGATVCHVTGFHRLPIRSTRLHWAVTNF